MRKISEQAADALIFNNSLNKGNTKVIKCVGGSRMYLHGNLIAENINGSIRITNAGWRSNVTKERLNALPNGVKIVQEKGEWYLNDIPWDGSWIKIN